jgi:lipid A 3-O-deacylase
MRATAAAALAVASASAASAQSFSQPFTQTLGIDEVKIGALYHDMPGLWSGFSLERPAADLNGEILFRPWARTFGGSLRPAIGATVNLNGEASKAYADLRWEFAAQSGIFFGIGLGAAVHNGDIGFVDNNHKALGARVLFHPTAEIGYRFDGANSISIFADHMSNGYSRRFNDGMDTLGLRFGHKFGPAIDNSTTRGERPIDRKVGDFSGFYVGAAGGYQMASANWSAGLGARQSGPAAAGFLGYNWQSGQGVFGFEVDATLPRATLKTTCRPPNISCELAERGLFSLRPRVGWVIDNSLFYFTGGFAFAGWDNSAVNTTNGRVLVSERSLSYGVSVGVGVEHKVSGNIGVRAEVLHYGVYGNEMGIPGIGVTATQFQNAVARMGLSWTFN